MPTPNLDHIIEPLRPLARTIEDLVLDPENTRLHGEESVEGLMRGFKEHGFRTIVIVQREGLIVREGNGRVMAARRLGWTHLPVAVVEESDIEAVSAAIADNRIAELSLWNTENLTAMLRKLQVESVDLNALGWADHELEPLLAAEFKPPTIDEAPIDRAGDESPEDGVSTITFTDEQWESLTGWLGEEPTAELLVAAARSYAR